ncbi:MAG: metal-dependent hydrolase [Methanosaeta sp. PtaB.Bin039]|nr:MAG: metal-dependent hydrolase [Methanosaeta sp. PtaB.Bin039]OPY45596.1 MAG: metal-dependent hydrolase [Methanosaeta sp. PtaU1.Bin028]HOT07263.1 RNase J family beta-CASP ribonuclease [Methanotrichaceae archaeon]HQF17291.1 RNase J family beta-CASP ribonuclease [Methanotrichaceae archaeon]HQI91864.1 RNase J family beta-CASP ribonuclease [Methanotrichaceae archaeon]
MSNVGIVAVGGYDEIGRNMTAIRIGQDVVVMDMGVRLDRVQIHEDTDVESLHSSELIAMGAIPDDSVIENSAGQVRVIACTHGHLDHIGAISKLAHRYKAPIVATPFTADLINQEIKSERIFNVGNQVISMKAGEKMQVTPDIELEFVRVQHSIVDCVFAAIHTKFGVILYANDFKIDRNPTLGEPPDFQRLRQLGRKGVLALITETTNAGISGKTPSEQIAKDLVWDVLMGTEESRSGVLVTTFSSHIARIKAIIEAARKMGRKPVLLGRSMEKYWGTAIRTGYADRDDGLTVYGRRKSVDKALKRIMQEGKDKYLPIMTGHQGEPGAILSRVANGETEYQVDSGDKVVFSAGIIPQPLNISNRYIVETKLKMKGARIYDNIHVSGHACREDHWELLRMINPQHVIPSHGTLSTHGSYLMMAEETGYNLGYSVHMIRNGQELILD